MLSDANTLFQQLVGLKPAQPRSKRDEAALRKQVRALVDAFERTAAAIVAALIAGAITLAEFSSAMRGEIRQLHLAAAIIAHGGAESVSPATLAQAQRQIDAQMVYFNRWMEELHQQEQARLLLLATGGLLALRALIPADQMPRSPEALSARAKMYGSAATETFARTETAALGVPTLPFYPADRTVCHVYCHCFWTIVPVNAVRGDWNCFWTLGIAEHCPTCLARSRAANPLKVRGGIIVNAQKYQAANLYA